MADNTQVTAGSGDFIRDKDRLGVKTQIVGLDLGIGTGTESLMAGSLPVSQLVTGAFGYTAGTAGTASIAASAKVQTITAHCTTAGSMTINGGASIPIPANSSFSAAFTDGKLVAPAVVFTGTDSYYIDWLV